MLKSHPPTSIPALIAMKKWQIGGADVNKVMDFNEKVHHWRLIGGICKVFFFLGVCTVAA